jgi:hypothetical protein
MRTTGATKRAVVRASTTMTMKRESIVPRTIVRKGMMKTVKSGKNIEAKTIESIEEIKMPQTTKSTAKRKASPLKRM